MPEWLYEAGIGESRAALVEDGTILAARIEPDDGSLRVGTIAQARLIERLSPQMGVIHLEPPNRAPAQAGALRDEHSTHHTAFLPAQEHGRANDREAILDRAPPTATLGQSLLIEIVREAIPEPGRPKFPRARLATDGATEQPGPNLLARIADTGHPVRTLRPHEPDALEAAGWSEVLEEARTGAIRFPLGALRLSPTPAMALFDVDGPAPLAPLALAAARAVAAAIERHDIGGSIGIDFPTLSNKAERVAVGEAIDAALAQPFQRTAVNGFGFLQIVRPRPQASLPEILRADPVATTARAALRTLERTPPGASNAVRLPAAVIARIDAEGWRTELERRTGVVARLESQ